MPVIETKTKRYVTIILQVGLWLTYSFRNWYANGLTVRLFPYSYAADFSFSGGLAIAIYVLSGLLNMLIIMLVTSFMYNIMTSRTRRLFIAKQDFQTVFYGAVVLNNLVTGIVFMLCYVFPLMYPLVNSIIDIVVFTPILTGAYFFMKKYFTVPSDIGSKVYLWLMLPFLIYQLVLFLFGLISGVIA